MKATVKKISGGKALVEFTNGQKKVVKISSLKKSAGEGYWEVVWQANLFQSVVASDEKEAREVAEEEFFQVELDDVDWHIVNVKREKNASLKKSGGRKDIKKDLMRDWDHWVKLVTDKDYVVDEGYGDDVWTESELHQGLRNSALQAAHDYGISVDEYEVANEIIQLLKSKGYLKRKKKAQV